MCDLATVQQEHDILAEQLKLQEGKLSSVGTERDELTMKFAQESEAFAETNSMLTRSRQQLEQSQHELAAAREERERAIHQLDLCKNDLSAVQIERDQLVCEQQVALKSIAQLTETLADRDRAIAIERDQLRAEVETTKDKLGAALQSLRDECEMLKIKLSSIGDDNDRLREQHRFVEQLYAKAQARNDELVAAENRLQAEHSARLQIEQIKYQELLEELAELRANSEETDRLAEELISSALDQPSVRLASAEELEAARAHVTHLKLELAHAEDTNRALAETLESVGIRLWRRSVSRWN